jgi:phosphoglucan,water dikinase
VAELAEGDRTRRSWREKLDFVRELLAREKPAVTSDQLVDIAIYLRFLGTGEIACSEDGRHFRPAQHARLASQIQDRLAGLTTPENLFIVRKIYPWLPSSAPAFQRPEPLTRIRDIAHRNDIPQDLKRELKTTLQNKLHRCAGPEDLATSAALLKRFTAAGASYSSAFVDQFKIFHEELKEFFNAQSLEQRLNTVAPALKGRGAELVERFLKQKAHSTAAAAPGKAAGELLATFSTLTDLRQACLELVTQNPGAETEALLLADIALEDFAFVLLSEIINACDRPNAGSATGYQTEALTLALQNLVLSGIDPSESTVAQNELKTWGDPLPSANRNELLRQKATLLRCRRLAEDFGDRVVTLFSARVEKLGRALGVAPHAVRVFAEADIRSHLVFQVSKLATGLLRRIRQQLKLPPWDVLVPGRAVGRATMIASLDGWQRVSQEPVLILLQQAAGDEEIPGGVSAILLAHEMPHLSHLAVRARQAGIVFVACEEVDEFKRLQKLNGQSLSLLATPDAVTWETTSRQFVAQGPPPVGDGSSTADDSPSPLMRGEGRGEGSDDPRIPTAQARQPSLRLPFVKLSPEAPCISLEQATAENSGGKASGVRLLLQLFQRDHAGFNTAAALVVPFGVMEKSLRAVPAVDAEYRKLAKELNGMPPVDFDAAARRLRELVQELTVPEAIISEVQRKFSPISSLVVRSSANCEDTEEFAGAGLYESVLNVPPSDVETAIRKVWSSLWTRRASLSRLEAGIPHDQAHMAVLIQELVDADFAFVLHTVNPVTRDPDALYAEIVVGLGETLVSAATAGEPYRLTCDKKSEAIAVLAFANFSHALRPSLHRETLDYSRIDLSREPATLESLGRRLCRIGAFVEQALEKPQDIEGAVVKDTIYLLQTRPQQGLSTGKPS